MSDLAQPRAATLVQTRQRGIVSAPATAGTIDVCTESPPDDLADVVATFWRGRWDRRAQGPHTTELLSDPCVNLVFERGSSRIVGVWTRLWTRTLSGTGLIRAVKLRAGAVRAFIDTPAWRLKNRILPLHESEIEDRVLAADDDAEAFRTLGQWLRERRSAVDDVRVAQACTLVDRIADDRDLATVEALAAHAKLGRRALQRLFRDYVGASPKWVIRRRRLQDAAVAIDAGAPMNLARLAADLGYTDAAHLTRDFKAAVGKPPSALLRR